MELLFKGTLGLQEYHNPSTGIHAVAGQTVAVSEVVAKELLADFPGVFVEIIKQQPKVADLDTPPVDKQIKRAKRK